MHCLINLSKPLPSPKVSLLHVGDVYRVTWSPGHLSQIPSPKCIDHAKKAWEDTIQLGKVNHKIRMFFRHFPIHEMHAPVSPFLGFFFQTEMTDIFC